MSLKDFGTKSSPRTRNAPSFIDRPEGEYINPDDIKSTGYEWSEIGPGKYYSVGKTIKGLPAGSYDIGWDERSSRPIYIKKDLVHDIIIPLSGLPHRISEEIKDFWTKEKNFTDLGFLHRRGYLFYGPQGTGKSSLVQEIASDTIKEGGIVFYCSIPQFFGHGLVEFRKVEPHRPIVCIFEDIDAIIRRWSESEILSILDGENQVGRVCNIATTNYPELLDKRIVGRPRRFDRVYKIGNLDKSAREAFFKKKLPKGANLAEWVRETNGLSIASMSEVMISVFCLGMTIKESVKIIKELTEDKSSNEYREERIGFHEEAFDSEISG